MTAVDELTVRQACRELWTAARLHRPVPPIRDLFEPGDIDSGYAVQELLTLCRLRDGGRVIGHKIGLTSPAVQRQLGVDQPDFGVLFHDMLRTGREPIDLASLIAPKIEAEVAFVLAGDLDDPELTPAAVQRKVAYVQPALEIVDSRVGDWDISIVDTVADNASSGLFVLGDKKTPLNGLDLIAARMTMTTAGEVVSHGTGADCLGDPVLAVLWLARKLRDLGLTLRAGEIVLAGALGPMATVRAGATYHAEISGLGTVSAGFEQRKRL
ncbi:2-keto-4-pentenoate hydratase [Amycolatopsis acidicola]|uniref:2-keto-4-pentenoate hydratase n=1 Tax=Amycolatopsis acidicola TaxID=2596893 RepID=A0A5N0VK18_9PSEU|nr:fumarylacetoacetate hydrolase family protein [Amycolatopsis acidicola]KAA9166038.1 2-keto-4-pentenoate hydratase [Amycolatopsis acidicola]